VPIKVPACQGPVIMGWLADWMGFLMVPDMASTQPTRPGQLTELGVALELQKIG